MQLTLLETLKRVDLLVPDASFVEKTEAKIDRLRELYKFMGSHVANSLSTLGLGYVLDEFDEKNWSEQFLEMNDTILELSRKISKSLCDLSDSCNLTEE